MVVLAVAAVAVVCIGGMVWLLSRSGGDVSRDADRFAAARAMTNRWAQDPASAPKPVLDIARQRSPTLPTASPKTDASDAGGR